MSGNYDHLVLGEGNPLHPANREVETILCSHNLRECLNYFYASKEPEALELAIDFHQDKLDKVKEMIIALTVEARQFGNDYIANKLCAIRNELEND